MTTPAEYARQRRDAARGAPPRQPVPCGTPMSRAPIMRHRRRGEPLCDACRAEEAAINAANYLGRK